MAVLRASPTPVPVPAWLIVLAALPPLFVFVTFAVSRTFARRSLTVLACLALVFSTLFFALAVPLAPAMLQEVGPVNLPWQRAVLLGVPFALATTATGVAWVIATWWATQQHQWGWAGLLLDSAVLALLVTPAVTSLSLQSSAMRALVAARHPPVAGWAFALLVVACSLQCPMLTLLFGLRTERQDSAQRRARAGRGMGVQVGARVGVQRR
jgi:hypothetical protein